MSTIKKNTNKKRNSIIDAATKAFQQEGYDAASMDMIAKMAGASKRTVYNYFESKEALFQAVLAKAFEDIMELKKIPYDKEKPLKKQMEQFADAKLAFVENPAWLGLTRVLFSIFVKDPEFAKETIERAANGEDALVNWLKEANLDGRLNVPDPELAAELFWSCMGGTFIWPMAIFGPMEKERINILKEELVDMFLKKYLP